MALSFTAYTPSYTNLEAIKLNTLANGGRYSYILADDIPDIAPEANYGGTPGGIVTGEGQDAARRTGMSRNAPAITAPTTSATRQQAIRPRRPRQHRRSVQSR